MSGAPARRAAGDLIALTLDKRRTLDEAMQASAAFNALEGADRAFARAIASATLRRLGWIDTALAPLLSRPLGTTTAPIRALLRAGAAQLWFMDVAPHAAVSETVEAARQWPEARSGGAFLNAVLRRVAETASPGGRLPPEAIWPPWLQAAMVDGIGYAGARRLAAAQLDEPVLMLTPRMDAANLADRIGGRLLPSGSVAAPPGSVEDIDGYTSGDWWVQDAAAALPARLLAPAPGETVLDLCAAPGGKTLQLAAMGAKVTALDRSAARLRRLSENLERTGLSATVLTADAETWRPAQTVSKILLDAPCSALGTLRRHPEGAWIKTAADLARFPAVQTRLLEAAAAMLAPGGRLVYCVCTPLPAEGLAVINENLERLGLVRDNVLPAEAEGFEGAITDQGDLLTLPSPGDGCDAFFIARLMRQEKQVNLLLDADRRSGQVD